MATDIIARGMAAQALKQSGGGGSDYTAGTGIDIDENNVITNSLSEALTDLDYESTRISKSKLRHLLNEDMLPIYGSIDLIIDDDDNDYSAVLNLASYKDVEVEEDVWATTFIYTSNVVDNKYWKLTFTASNLDSGVPCVIEEINVGSSASESYYKIELDDYNVANTVEEKLILMLETSDFNDILTEINNQMGTNLQSPQDLITFYNSVKGNTDYYGSCCLLFATMCELCIRNNTNAVFVDYDLSAYNKITTAINDPIPTVKSDGMLVIGGVSIDDNTSITFTSASRLSIVEQSDQKIRKEGEK